MNLAVRRLLALVAVFLSAFIAVAALRAWRNGNGLRDLFPIFSKNKTEYRPENYTFTEKVPLDLGEVELLSRLNEEYAKLTAAVVPSVVSIDTAGVQQERLVDFWGQTRGFRPNPTRGQGSGVIVTSEGHIVTNHHVIAGQQEFQITLHNGKKYSARLIGEDSLLDIAVLRIDSKENFTPLKIGDSSQVKVGQIVMAVGNPFGLGETVTQGIISAKERSLSENQRDLFQTDAAINPGNSGGPLINLRGEIIGINVAIFSPDKQNPGFQGVGFSIPSNDVKESLVQILERGRPIYGFLGVKISDLDRMTRSSLGNGAEIIEVTPDSPAQAAGLQPRDVVRAINGEEIVTPSQMLALLQRSKVGETIALDLWRAGRSLQVKATIGESGAANSPSPKPMGAGKAQDPEVVLEAIGVQVRDLSVRERMSGYRGVVVIGIAEQSIAQQKLAVGDLIVSVNNSRISGANDFYLYLAESAAAGNTNLRLIRGGQMVDVDLPVISQ
ncbi:MAG: PDZ domain-containing protein [Akkermansiaceae bacterium]|nr:PDZ domain-containing protein [Akkermansiaceae bacterium]